MDLKENFIWNKTIFGRYNNDLVLYFNCYISNLQIAPKVFRMGNNTKTKKHIAFRQISHTIHVKTMEMMAMMVSATHEMTDFLFVYVCLQYLAIIVFFESEKVFLTVTCKPKTKSHIHTLSQIYVHMKFKAKNNDLTHFDGARIKWKKKNGSTSFVCICFYRCSGRLFV